MYLTAVPKFEAMPISETDFNPILRITSDHIQ